MRQGVTLIGQGAAANNVAANTLVAAIVIPSPGRYKVWGHCRHSLIDGLKLSSPTTVVLAGGAGDTISFGPMIFDIASVAIGIGISLNTATGASDTAAATIYAELINQ